MGVMWQLSEHNLKLKLGQVLLTYASQDSDLAVVLTSKEIIILSILKIFQKEIYIQHYCGLEEVFSLSGNRPANSRKLNLDYSFKYIGGN